MNVIPKRKYMKISVQLHNELHYKLGLGVLTIQNLIDMGISERNAYIIKKHSAYTGKRHGGNERLLHGKLASSFYVQRRKTAQN